MKRLIPTAATAAIGALAAIVLMGAASTLALRDDGIQFPDGSVQTSAAGSPGTTIPVQCERTIDTLEMESPLPLGCKALDGTVFENVPAGYHFYITDVFWRKRVTSQTTVNLALQIWEDDISNPTGCVAGVPVGTFGVSQNFERNDFDVSGFHHVAYQTPYFVLTPQDCIIVFVFNGSVSGGVVEVSGFLWDRIGAPMVGSSGT